MLVDILNVTHASCSPAGSPGSGDKYQSVGTDRMAAGDLAVGMIFLTQAILGILENVCLLSVKIYFTH